MTSVSRNQYRYVNIIIKTMVRNKSFIHVSHKLTILIYIIHEKWSQKIILKVKFNSHLPKEETFNNREFIILNIKVCINILFWWFSQSFVYCDRHVYLKVIFKIKFLKLIFSFSFQKYNQLHRHKSLLVYQLLYSI